MDLQPDAVPQPVAEMLAEAGLVDHVASDVVDVVAACAGPDRGDGGSWALNTTPYTRSSLGGILPVPTKRVKSLL